MCVWNTVGYAVVRLSVEPTIRAERKTAGVLAHINTHGMTYQLWRWRIIAAFVSWNGVAGGGWWAFNNSTSQTTAEWSPNWYGRLKGHNILVRSHKHTEDSIKSIVLFLFSSV